MTQTFKQKSNAIVAFSFIGLILICQIWIWSIGYIMPMYFFVLLALFCGLILWGMLDTKCVIDGNVLKSRVGPFVQKIAIDSITEIKCIQKGKEGSRKRRDIVRVFCDGKKKLEVALLDADGFVQALQKINQKIKVQREK